MSPDYLSNTFAALADPSRRARLIARRREAQWRFTNPLCEVDRRPGGSIRIHMPGLDGAIYPMTGVFCEIVPPERRCHTSRDMEQGWSQSIERLAAYVPIKSKEQSA